MKTLFILLCTITITYCSISDSFNVDVNPKFRYDNSRYNNYGPRYDSPKYRPSYNHYHRGNDDYYKPPHSAPRLRDDNVLLPPINPPEEAPALPNDHYSYDSSSSSSEEDDNNQSNDPDTDTNPGIASTTNVGPPAAQSTSTTAGTPTTCTKDSITLAKGDLAEGTITPEAAEPVEEADGKTRIVVACPSTNAGELSMHFNGKIAGPVDSTGKDDVIAILECIDNQWTYQPEEPTERIAVNEVSCISGSTATTSSTPGDSSRPSTTTSPPTIPDSSDEPPTTHSTTAPLTTEETTPASTNDPASTTQITTPSTTEESTPATTEEATPATTEAATPETTEAATPETTEAATPETTEAATPATTEAATPSTTEAATPETTEAATPATTEATTPETTEAATPETTEVATPETTGAATPETTETATQATTEAATPSTTETKTGELTSETTEAPTTEPPTESPTTESTTNTEFKSTTIEATVATTTASLACSVDDLTLTEGTVTPTRGEPATDADGGLSVDVTCPATNGGEVFLQFNEEIGGPTNPNGEVTATLECIDNQWIYKPDDQTEGLAVNEVNCVAASAKIASSGEPEGSKTNGTASEDDHIKGPFLPASPDGEPEEDVEETEYFE